MPVVDLDFDLGTPGASARREHERRRANRHARTRADHPRIGGALLALRDDPAHETAWAAGASGEEQVAKGLARRLAPGIVVLHDRALPRSRANIDHIAVAPSGVWVIDSKRYKGKAAVHRPLLGKPRLTIAGRDQTKLVHGLVAQVELVESAVPGLPVQGALCFVETDLPLIGTLTLDGIPLLWPKGLAKRINKPGPVAADGVLHIARELAARFPVA